MLVARSKTDFVFIFFILGTFLVLKGGWGTPKVGLVQKTIGKVIGRCVGNLGNIVCTSNPNNGQGHQNAHAQGLAAMRAPDLRAGFCVYAFAYTRQPILRIHAARFCSYAPLLKRLFLLIRAANFAYTRRLRIREKSFP